MTISMYVISNGELARETLNAVVTLLGSGTFGSAIRISLLFSILAASINYVRSHDIVILAKWFLIYFGITVIMLGPKVNLQIIDSSNPGRADLTVANVPYGLGYPASIITTVSHKLVTAFESAFHMPDEFSYNKTGLLFGSKLFSISTEFQVIDPGIRSELSEYVKNCVLGDILITKKYSMSDLTESKDLLDTITKDPSNIRGIYVGDKFKTCLAARNDIKNHIEGDIQKSGFEVFGKKVFGYSRNKENAHKFKDSLEKVYGYYDYTNYDNLSSSALQIITQNVLINGIREGIVNYSAEAGATAALLNLSTTQAMDRMRMTLATSKNIAIYTIPIIHTTLLLQMLGLFPVIIFLAFQPSLTNQVLKNYLYTVCWLESWPLMFACLNLIVNFYTKSEIGSAGLTLSNIDQLALEHSDIANMAGYLMLSIPFISGGLVKGMSSAFNHAASYIGGALQSSATSAANGAATGNIHLGNSSWNNVNANKFDTSSTLMRGMATEQLPSGVLRTTRPEGEVTYDSSHAISRLPTTAKSSEFLSESFSEQAETAKTASIQDQKNYEESMSNAVSDFASLGNTVGTSKNYGENFTTRESKSAAENYSDMRSMSEAIAKREGVDVNDVFRGIVNFSQGGSFNLGVSGSAKTPSVNVMGIEGKAGLDGKISAEHTRSREANTQHGVGRSINITADEAQRFSKDLHAVEEYSKVSHADTNNSTAASQLSQFSTDLRNARSASTQHSVHKAESERLSGAASYVKQHSGQIDSDLGQEIANHVVKVEGREEAETLFAGKNRPKLEKLAKNYIDTSGIESSILSKYQQSSAGISPEKKYQAEGTVVDDRAQSIKSEYGKQKQRIDDEAKASKVVFDEAKYDRLIEHTNSKEKEIGETIKNRLPVQNDKYNVMKNDVINNIKKGKEKSQSSAFNVKDSIRPKFLNSDKEKK